MNTQRSQSPLEDQQAVDDAWLDDALAQSFPASDPVPHFHRDPPAAHTLARSNSSTDTLLEVKVSQ